MNRNEKMTRRKFLKGALGTVAGVSLGGVLSPEKSFAKKPPIKIGFSLSLTGKYAWTGQRQHEGLKVWQKLINEKGFTPGLEKYGQSGPGLIDGRTVEFIVYDDKSDPATAVKL